MIKPGDKAPDFTLKDSEGNPIKLSDMKGSWVVLYFYPKDATPGCTTEALQFTQHIADFKNANAQVLGVSADSCESHQRFMVKFDLKVKLLSDPQHKVLERYSAWGEKKLYGKIFMGINRSTVLIDPEGKIAHHWPNVKADGHAEEVKAKLTELQK
ncbi:thioredoxin-dependent thiol peroxidase [candidate division TA06 bacterium B3_TA06]|uniref:thioredoxin-dependent peroxiredoxin n=1 Tax=candidate division TA06 bacterium B3_TA06 TaxID=2012487 RepID=A0A532USV9_UNCT6|nr:MAG: thioredoxin-dependent thiol peroxidase [candidate division TA06 bacterium B3_TA06]